MGYELRTAFMWVWMGPAARWSFEGHGVQPLRSTEVKNIYFDGLADCKVLKTESTQ
jgi:hypothetical protein